VVAVNFFFIFQFVKETWTNLLLLFLFISAQASSSSDMDPQEMYGMMRQTSQTSTGTST
jgi:hypothetical protein